MPVISAASGAKIKKITVPSQLGQIVWETLSQKYPTQKRAGGVAQVVDLLPSKCKALSSNPSMDKKEKCGSYEVNLPLDAWLVMLGNGAMLGAPC
jgi:hypothetical protein